ncbi:DJ-1/PfpI family protein [Robiginitalea sp. IMCC44478]|uniref:DJ-1/PfpI family protein n=1 Tax=Robiginitalea sp. IMCC44478 TaxID=3459122 RepID=UPI004041BC70
MRFFKQYVSFRCLLLGSCLLIAACREQATNKVESVSFSFPDSPHYKVGFLIMDGVYNTELTAPYDIFQHTVFREGITPMIPFTLAKESGPVRTFEGIKILPDFVYGSGNWPEIDILVVPSAEHHLDTDLQDSTMIRFVQEAAKNARFVTSHCDGAFVLAQAGLLDEVVSTTFPADVDTYRQRFPQLQVADSVWFVHDGKFITSAGGARSFEAALYLCELLYGEAIAKDLAKGLVIDWDLKSVPHMLIP